MLYTPCRFIRLKKERKNITYSWVTVTRHFIDSRGVPPLKSERIRRNAPRTCSNINNKQKLLKKICEQ